ncbi:hypothetical protein [Streptomyces sp. NPDC093109]|uniref:hypothetical protein n=1 Tax=Streptomyces sp. NPDC093109 TaxID=3154977 RepID=UPI00344B60F3
MSVQLTTDPDPARSGVGAVTVSTWRVGTPARQRATVEAISRAWRARAWPDAGLLSYSVAVGEDGDTLLHYAQWSGEAAYERFAAASRDERVAEIDAAVPGIERVDGTRVLNYAEWESARAHIDALAAPGEGVGFATAEWARVRAYTGVRGSTVTRYTPAISLSAG